MKSETRNLLIVITHAVSYFLLQCGSEIRKPITKQYRSGPSLERRHSLNVMEQACRISRLRLNGHLNYFVKGTRVRVTARRWRSAAPRTRSKSSAVRSVSVSSAAPTCSVRTTSTTAAPRTAHSSPKPNTVSTAQ